MATYYVDPAATGANTGTSWTNAWTTLQTAADTAVAGDVVYCRGTQNLTAAIDFDTNSGAYDSGYIRFVGCNSSGVVDGTHFTLNGQDNAIIGIAVNAKHYLSLENIKIHSCNGTAGMSFGAAYADYCRLVNMWFHDNSGYGLTNNTYGRYLYIKGCRFSSNGSHGYYRPAATEMISQCSFIDNSGRGLDSSQGFQISDCLFHNNAGGGLLNYGTQYIKNCVFDGNGQYGVNVTYNNSRPVLVGCRITNHTAGIGVTVTGFCRPSVSHCYFGGNGTDITAGRYEIDNDLNLGTSHVIFNGGDVNHGYVDPANDNFTLRLDASLKESPVTIGNSFTAYLAAGLPDRTQITPAEIAAAMWSNVTSPNRSLTS